MMNQPGFDIKSFSGIFVIAFFFELGSTIKENALLGKRLIRKWKQHH